MPQSATGVGAASEGTPPNETGAHAPERFAVLAAWVKQRSLGERLGRWAWGSFGLGSLLFGAGMLGTALQGMNLALAVAILGGTAAVYAWPVALAISAFMGRRRKLAAKTLSLEGKSLVLYGETGERTTFAGPYRQGAVMQGGLLVEDEAGREFTATMDAAAAERLVDALDLEPEKRRFTFRWQNTRARVSSWLTGFFGFSMVAVLPLVLADGRPEYIGLATACSILLAPPLFAELTSRWWSRRELTVGLDGIEHRSRQGRELLRFTDVVALETASDALVAKMRDGTEHRMLVDPGDPAERAAIEQRIREAMAIARAKAGTHTVAGALLDRAGRSLSEWREAAARVLTAATGFRDARLEPQDLGAVLEDASATAEQRVAAAIALTSVPEHRPRVRVAADTVASPKLRVALEGLAEGTVDEEALAGALEEDAAARAR